MPKVATIMRKGARGPLVTELQKELGVLGFNPGAIDGEFGPNTLKAVIAFQKSMGLKADGEVGPHTSAAIEEMLAKKARTSPKPAAKTYTPTEVRPIPTSTAGEPASGRSVPAGEDDGLGGARVVLTVLGVLALAAAALAYLVWG